ncbi:MAG: ribosome biogenesis GTP-binding protein YihA/YsxC [Deltaproteobacteria bacterium]|jgi:GTP-binding protein|nr:ribosome biogenesis GTP-binding protein YihA/YsxC [Deltaproteobacteria bacterium]
MSQTKDTPPAYSADFVVSAAAFKQFPEPLDFEVALLGRSNSGKSSLLNRFIGRKSLARVSGTPGRTRLINFFKIAWTKEEAPFYVADLPGYGFAAAPKDMVAGWQELVNSYLKAKRPNRLALLLMDIRRDPQIEEKNLVQWLKDLAIDFRLVATKADKLNSSARSKRLKIIQKDLQLPEPPLMFSALSGEGREVLISALRQKAQSD